MALANGTQVIDVEIIHHRQARQVHRRDESAGSRWENRQWLR